MRDLTDEEWGSVFPGHIVRVEDAARRSVFTLRGLEEQVVLHLACDPASVLDGPVS